MAQPTIPSLLTEAEAAAILRIAPRTLRALRSKGLIRYVCPAGNRIRYREDDLAEYIERQTVEPRQTCVSAPAPKAVSRAVPTRIAGIIAMRDARRQRSAVE